MAKPLHEQHVFDYRPRFKQADHDLLQALARRRDVPVNVLVREIVVAQLRKLDCSETTERSC